MKYNFRECKCCYLCDFVNDKFLNFYDSVRCEKIDYLVKSLDYCDAFKRYKDDLERFE